MYTFTNKNSLITLYNGFNFGIKILKIIIKCERHHMHTNKSMYFDYII